HDDTTYRIGHAISYDKVNWTKSPSNPVVDLGSSGSWDSNSVGACTVLDNGTKYHMWYSGMNDTYARVGYAAGHAKLPDIGSWIKNPVNPVLTLGSSGVWDDYYVGHPTILYKDNVYHMWYSGDDGTSTLRIGYANSTDGVMWIKNPTNPVLDVGPGGSWDGARTYSPTVIFDGAIYHMWYTGYNDTNFRIGYANSSDGITWIKHPQNPVLDLGSPGEWDDSRVYAPCVLYDGIKFHMWYSGFDGLNYRMGYANSSDGVTWVKNPANPILSPGPSGTWDDSRVFAPSVIFRGKECHMWYTGNDGSIYRIGYATSYDGFTWIKSVSNPVLDLGPSSSWDEYNVHQPSVFYEGITYHMWYSGEDGPNSRIGHAVLSLNWTKYDFFAEVLDAYEITGITAGIPYNIVMNVPSTADLDIFIFNATGGRDDALASSTSVGAGMNEYFTFTADTSGDYLLVVTNEDGGNGSYTISFDDEPPTITDVTAQPDPQEVFGVVRISAAINDDFQVGETWVEIHDPVGGLVGNFSMSYDSGNNRYYNNQNYDILGDYTFTIWASDVVNQWNSASGTFTIQDTTPPIISDVTEAPDPQEVFGNVNISASITDNYQMFGAWIEINDPDGDLIENISMSIDPISGKYYFDQTYDILGTHSYTIWANDTNSNWGSYSGTFVIQDTTPPLILGITSNPNPQEVFGSVYISANVTDNFQLNEVWAEIRDPVDNLVGNFPMSYDPVESRYYWLQFYDVIGTYTYTIQANDTSNNIASATSAFLIQDTTPPEISDVTLEPDLQVVFEEQKLSAIVTDNYQLYEVWITIFDPYQDALGNFSMVYDPIEGRYFLNHTFNISGEHTYTIWASDTSGNFASYSDTFDIEPEKDPDEYNWKPIIALAFVLILLILGILVVYIHPMKFTGILEKDRGYSLFAGVLPFVIAEAITGIISLFTGFLVVPPIIGLGMIVDLIILIAGIISCLVIYKKGVSLESYQEVAQPRPPETSRIPSEPSQSDNGIVEPTENPKTPLLQPNKPTLTPTNQLQQE
ncbi:MAG: hypothetical protein JSV09_16890, partial [Thermoplasmata archaeon]